uniref:basic proline-rich protein-like n=1 Tax=Agelaius phoeniceus TaxID=39638 RepID=UPI0023EAB1FE|nr:basic proline-rich protein-like [Agelaius phoeniceus]
MPGPEEEEGDEGRTGRDPGTGGEGDSPSAGHRGRDREGPCEHGREGEKEAPGMRPVPVGRAEGRNGSDPGESRRWGGAAPPNRGGKPGASPAPRDSPASRTGTGTERTGSGGAWRRAERGLPRPSPALTGSRPPRGASGATNARPVPAAGGTRSETPSRRYCVLDPGRSRARRARSEPGLCPRRRYRGVPHPAPVTGGISTLARLTCPVTGEFPPSRSHPPAPLPEDFRCRSRPPLVLPISCSLKTPPAPLPGYLRFHPQPRYRRDLHAGPRLPEKPPPPPNLPPRSPTEPPHRVSNKKVLFTARRPPQSTERARPGGAPPWHRDSTGTAPGGVTGRHRGVSPLWGPLLGPLPHLPPLALQPGNRAGPVSPREGTGREPGVAPGAPPGLGGHREPPPVRRGRPGALTYLRIRFLRHLALMAVRRGPAQSRRAGGGRWRRMAADGGGGRGRHQDGGGREGREPTGGAYL